MQRVKCIVLIGKKTVKLKEYRGNVPYGLEMIGYCLIRRNLFS